MGLRNAFDVALQAGVNVMLFFRGFWDVLPLVVRALIFFSFGLIVLFAVLKMIF